MPLSDAKTRKNTPKNTLKRPIASQFHTLSQPAYGASTVSHPPAIGHFCNIALDASVCRHTVQHFPSFCRLLNLREFAVRTVPPWQGALVRKGIRGAICPPPLLEKSPKILALTSFSGRWPQAAEVILAVSWTPRAFITASVVFSVGFPLVLKER